MADLQPCPFCGAKPWQPPGKSYHRVVHVDWCYLSGAISARIYPEDVAAWQERRAAVDDGITRSDMVIACGAVTEGK